MGSRKRITLALAALIVLVLGGWLIRNATSGGTGVPPPSSAAVAPGALPGADSGLPVAPLSTLPSQARDTWQLIAKGGPYPHRQDGVVFQNREKLLPSKDSGYYHEYTVDTPGSADRGARRLIEGDRMELYYTGDHYRSFVLVDPRR